MLEMRHDKLICLRSQQQEAVGWPSMNKVSSNSVYLTDGVAALAATRLLLILAFITFFRLLRFKKKFLHNLGAILKDRV